MVPRSWFVDGEQEWARIKMGSAEIGFRSRRFTALRFARLLKKGWASFGQLQGSQKVVISVYPY